ncbi:subtilisin-like protease 1 [Lingula anatina]|uniref:Subtilisin-like protease 1 n=1 Tax=Lingula anatina TaxID=7574 RepID=A0A1S3IH86_LINAN|nr:subtilisin-like protease 1 [Lingula anatina]|eukprot:XP_013397620.1 subtilisin-like protease 1 [Lingula anatina]
MMTSQMVSFVLIIGAIAITCGAAGLFVTESDQNGVQDPLVSPADETKVALHTYTGEDGIPDTYIVKLRKDVTGQNVADVRDALESELLSSAEGRLTALGRSARVGEVMDFNEVQMVVVEAVKEDIQRLRQKTDMIEAIYQDGVVTTAQICFCPCDCPAEDRPNNKACQTSTNTAGNWGLDRIDQRDAALDGAFNIVGTGSDVNVYILDSGVYAEHEEFLREDGSSRVTYGAKANASWDDNDVMGHGTHLAGIIGGKNVGVAKNANLISVKVLDDFGMGQISGLVSMMYWVWLKVLIYRRKSLLVLSVVSPWNEALNSVVNDLVNFEIMVIAAAGNGNVPTRYVSPASAAQAVAVAASDIGDTRAIFSNYGEEIFLWAPGDMIKSSSPGSPNEYTVRSGTSMASAFVAGAAAAYMSSLDYNPTPQQVKTYLHEQASENVITDSPTEFNCRTELICLRPNFCDAQTVCESVTTTAKFLYVGCSQDEPKKSKKSKKSKKGKKTKKSKKGKNSK